MAKNETPRADNDNPADDSAVSDDATTQAHTEAKDTMIVEDAGETRITLDAGDAVADNAQDPLAAAEARIVELEERLAQSQDGQLRALAETENMRRRSQREREDAAKYAAVNLVRDLLSVADNLRRALDAAPDGEVVKALVEGISMVERELAGVLEKHHVKPVAGVGEPFDHNVHQAVVEMPTADIEPGNVAQVLQTGYTLHDRLLRPAMVAVAKVPD